MPLIACAMLASGCGIALAGRDEVDASLIEPSLTLDASTQQATTGQPVTLQARTANTLGLDPKVTWHATGGKLDLSPDQRAATITFDQPGAYIVTAELQLNGSSEPLTDAVNIQVNPAPTINLGHR